ncbi:zinc-finger domain-containing protein [Nitratireductor mangrovi]|uniref:Zinc-finger domain-containing protein n=1 Tax=Nitratireductor mangrovi TaxID=2599600 RepID=A0A5B8KZF7_9HYPH|nr:zinc-finger domain-containing protein [Nitratireductor mangrovi]QDZ00963.1 zinc-finger domain-containing protein [Nitratireductor mangrovi]
MAGHSIPHFQNDAGHGVIEIGVREFMCVGASEPYDHPHVFLDMGDDSEIVCPYCSTLYRHSSDLKGTQTRPEGCQFKDKAA